MDKNKKESKKKTDVKTQLLNKEKKNHTNRF